MAVRTGKTTTTKRVTKTTDAGRRLVAAMREAVAFKNGDETAGRIVFPKTTIR